MKNSKNSGFSIIAILLGIIVIVLAVGAGLRIHNTNSAKQQNQILNASAASADLVSFLKTNYQGCDKMVDRPVSQGTYRVIKQVNGFAKLGYGCGETQAFIIAKKTNTKWTLISPTNQFTVSGIPSCKMVDDNKIPRALTPKCAVETPEPQANIQNNLQNLRDVSN